MLLNSEQKSVLLKIENFLKSNKKIFILKGYAGTGKTTLLKELIEKYKEQNNFIPLASTGAASQVLGKKLDSKISTVHSEIYKFKEIEENKDEYNYKFETKNRKSLSEKQDVCIVDEASMIGNEEIDQETRVQFGTKRLLQDFLFKNKNSKIIFVGDPMQLPPVGSEISIALDKQNLESIFGVECTEITLTEIVRQDKNNSIQSESIMLRDCFENKKNYILKPDNKDILGINYDYIPEFYRKNRNTGIITYSNREALLISQNIRKKIFKDTSHKIVENEKLLVIFNNHKLGLMNGNIIKVIEILNEKSLDVNLEYENKDKNRKIKLKFVRAIIENEKEEKITTWILLNFLDDLFYPKDEVYISDALTKLSKQLNNCEYFDAIRVRYGYAITCHKAQGSEFDNVILESHIIREEKDYKWAYTGMTRAKEKLYLLKKPFIDSENIERELSISYSEDKIEEDNNLPNKNIKLTEIKDIQSEKDIFKIKIIPKEIQEKKNIVFKIKL